MENCCPSISAKIVPQTKMILGSKNSGCKSPIFCDNRGVRFLLGICLLSTTLLAQQPPTTESLRGASAISHDVIWLSGTHGTYLRTTNAGHTWFPAQVPGAEALDFRAAVAFSSDEAFLMSSGTGEQSRIYHTLDGGQHWNLQLTAANSKSFFDSMIFFDHTHGVVLGDPIPDESGKLHFDIEITEDAGSWHRLPPERLPEARPGEGAFAASNTCLAVVGDNLWFATGGPVSRVFHSPDRGQTWQVFPTPIVHGPASAGIFSIAFRDALHGVIAGGDYKHPNQDGPNLAFTDDGGRSWTLSPIHPQLFFTAAAYDRKNSNRLFLAATDFLLDFRPPANPRRINPPKKSNIKFNALAPYPDGGVFALGPKGSMLSIP